jgi:shikimate kinase
MPSCPPSGPARIPGNIILVGLMGAGKTSVGKVIAKRLAKQFFDSDHEIERVTGVKIPVIFEIEGEDGFRTREARAIAELTELDNIVLATGGGVVMREENRRRLASGGVVVYLRASVHDLWMRTRNDRNRPLLQTDNPMQKLRELYAIRDPLYRSVAHLIIDTGHQSVNTLAGRLEQRLVEHYEQTQAVRAEK